jgi:hypothetical protein
MATKDRSLGHLSKPPKPAAPDPGRNCHPGARVTHQDAIKVDPDATGQSQSPNRPLLLPDCYPRGRLGDENGCSYGFHALMAHD